MDRSVTLCNGFSLPQKTRAFLGDFRNAEGVVDFYMSLLGQLILRFLLAKYKGQLATQNETT